VTWAKQDLIIIKTFNSFKIVYALSFFHIGYAFNCFHIMYALSSFHIAQQEMLSFEPLSHATICLIYHNLINIKFPCTNSKILHSFLETNEQCCNVHNVVHWHGNHNPSSYFLIIQNANKKFQCHKLECS